MLIGIDASRLTVNQKTGVEVYTSNIIQEIITQSKDNFLLWGQKPVPEIFNRFPKRVTWKTLKSPLLWTQFRLSAELITHRSPDIIFIPSHVVPLIHKGNFVVTIHDVAFAHFPELYSRNERFYQNLALKTALKTTQTIIVPSQATKQDLVTLFKADTEKITVIYHGVNHDRFYPKKQDEDMPYGIKKPYLLFAGRLEHKKNLVNLIKAFGLLRQESRLNHQLVLVGKEGFGYAEIAKEINKLPPNIKEDIIETGYVTDSTYDQILRSADFFVFPSLYEGFGLPVLEAMACGIPVVASNVSSLPEVVGDAGLLINPNKPFSIAAAVSRLIHHPQEREELVKTGLKQAKKFTWQKAGQETLDVLHNPNRKNI